VATLINRRLFRLTGGARRWLLIGVLTSYLSTLLYIACLIVIAVGIRRTIDDEMDTGLAASLLLVLIVLLTARAILNWQSVSAAARYSNRARAMLRRLLYEKVANQEMAGGPFSISEAAQTAATGIDRLSAYFGRYVPQVFITLLLPPTIFFILGAFSWPVALVLLACVPLIPLSMLVIRRRAKGQARKHWQAYIRLGEEFLEDIYGLTTLKVFQLDGRAHREMNRAAEQFRTSIMTVLKGQLNSITVMDLIIYGASGIGMAVGLFEMARGRLTLTGLLLVLFLSTEFFMPLRRFGSLFHVAMTGTSAAERLFQLLDLPNKPSGEEKLPAAKRYEIVARGLCFSYDDGHSVLTSVDFSARTGKRIALVGASGSGKSTLAGLIAGLLRGYTGSLTINGVEVNRVAPEALFEKVALMSPESRLFTAGLRENLRLGNPQASDEQIMDTLMRVHLGTFVRDLKKGLDTPLSENGGNLSGGQKQRLLMARLLLTDRPIYIFDEATSSVDADSEAIMLAVMDELARNKLVLMISHRMYAVRDADRIYVLDHGRIVQAGTHEELIAADGPYRSFVREERLLEEGGSVCADS
jgi:ATP-binding cassette subfamily C protein